MIAAYFDERVVSSILFLGSILLMMGSMLLFTREIQIANTALDVHLSDLELHQEWEQYLKPKSPPRREEELTKDRNHLYHGRAPHHHCHRPGTTSSRAIPFDETGIILAPIGRIPADLPERWMG